ncbi:hypothetical protein LCGC14_2657090 [marine sediment metagenome]|uniref:Uncharacterized protein n=1 Tax=marine sediment metagenome TaxID=412755 RepID=A0A0F9CK51_9ZZZZ
MSDNLSKLLGRQDALTLRAWGQREGKTYDALVCLVDSYLTLLKERTLNRDVPKEQCISSCKYCSPRPAGVQVPNAATGLYLDDAYTTEQQLLARMLMAHGQCAESTAVHVARLIQQAGFVLSERAQRVHGVDRVDRRKDWFGARPQSANNTRDILALVPALEGAARALEVRAYDFVRIDPGCYCMGRKQCAPCYQRAGVRVLLHTGWQPPQTSEEDQ